MKNHKNSKFLFSTILFCTTSLLLFNSGCVRQSSFSKTTKDEKAATLKPFEKMLLEQEKEIEQAAEEKIKIPPKPIVKTPEPEEELKEEKPKKLTKKEQAEIRKVKATELDFQVQNTTGKTIYATCFAYIKKRPFTRWRWDKTKVYKIEPKQIVTIDVDTIMDKQDRENVYGYLAVFNNRKKAKDAIYELLDDKFKIDLDLLYKLKDHKVIVGVETYGFKGEILDYDFVPIKEDGVRYPELDFVVENQTGKPVYVTCFAYQIKEDQPVWKYNKTKVKKIKPYGMAIMDVDTIIKPYDRVYMRGYLGVFKNKQQAKDATFELLNPRNKVRIGRLAALKNKKVILEVEQYGIKGESIDFSVHPITKIDFHKAFGKM